MRIQMSLSGGVYGKLRLQSIDTSDDNMAFPQDLLGGIESNELRAYKVAKGKRPALPLTRTDNYQTEEETYHLILYHDDDTTSSYDIPKSELQTNVELKQLIDFVWSVAKPEESI